jgi:hypothetical protein
VPFGTQILDPGRSAIASDARTGRTTTVYVTGTLRLFDAPTNAAIRQRICLEVDASSGVVLIR